MQNLYLGDRVQAWRAPRAQAPTGVEARREPSFEGRLADVVDVYGSSLRVRWLGDSQDEHGWRRIEDFRLISRGS